MTNDQLLEKLEHWISLLSKSGQGTKEKVRQEMIELKDSLNSTKEVKDNE